MSVLLQASVEKNSSNSFKNEITNKQFANKYILSI